MAGAGLTKAEGERRVETSCSLAVGFVFGSLIVALQAAVGRVRRGSGG